MITTVSHLNSVTPQILPISGPGHYTLFLTQHPEALELCLQVINTPLTTYGLPHITPLLRELIPSVLRSQCFNDQGLPFRKEVYATEVGHVYEHVLLEFLTREQSRIQLIPFRGLTAWNWQTDPRGVFHIQVQGPIENQTQIYKAIVNTNRVFESLFQTTLMTPWPYIQ